MINIISRGGEGGRRSSTIPIRHDMVDHDRVDHDMVDYDIVDHGMVDHPMVDSVGVAPFTYFSSTKQYLLC